MVQRPSRQTDRLRALLDDDPDPEAPLVGALLRFAHSKVQARILAELAAAGFADLNEAHFKVLRFPPPDGVRPSVLAERAGMTKQAMNYLLVQLEELGYVRRHEGEDSNGRLVSLTARGWKAGALMRRVVHSMEREWADKVGKAEFERFMDVLKQLAS